MHVLKSSWNLKGLLVLVLAWCAAITTGALCGSEDSCTKAAVPLCAMDTEKSCFKHFDSGCHMTVYACKRKKVFQIYEERFCKIYGFLCTSDMDRAKAPEYDFDQEIEHIRSREKHKFDGLFN